jgi:hypothetical protein
MNHSDSAFLRNPAIRAGAYRDDLEIKWADDDTVRRGVHYARIRLIGVPDLRPAAGRCDNSRK